MKKEQLLFGALKNKKRSTKIAYIGVLVALNIAVNALTSIPLGFVKFSFTISATALAGILLGPFLGFAVGFIGDLLAVVLGEGGGYTPFVGIAMGMVALLFGLFFYGFDWRFKWAWCVKIALASLLSFLIATVAIDTTVGFFLWNKTGLPYAEFAVVRLFVAGQVWNNVLNTAILYAVVPALAKARALPLQIVKNS